MWIFFVNISSLASLLFQLDPTSLPVPASRDPLMVQACYFLAYHTYILPCGWPPRIKLSHPALHLVLWMIRQTDKAVTVPCRFIEWKPEEETCPKSFPQACLGAPCWRSSPSAHCTSQVISSPERQVPKAWTTYGQEDVRPDWLTSHPLPGSCHPLPSALLYKGYLQGAPES